MKFVKVQDGYLNIRRIVYVRIMLRSFEGCKFFMVVFHVSDDPRGPYFIYDEYSDLSDAEDAMYSLVCGLNREVEQ